MKYLFIFFVFFALCFQAIAQNMIDSSLTIPLVGISYTYQIPGNDMAERYGNNHNIGGQFAIKLKSGVYIGIKAHYMWGENVKQRGVLDSIRTSEGGIIEVGGGLSDPIIDERGYSIFFSGGYLFPIFGPNPNSGLLITGGIGFLQHQYMIDWRDAQLPQLEGDYSRGYDRLSNGFALNEFIGYMHFGKKKLINFYVGMDFIMAWTKNKRGYNYDLRSSDDQTHFDTLTGIRIGWILALYKRAPNEFYYH